MVKRYPFGTTSGGDAVTAYCLENGCGMRVTVLDYGCTLQSVCVPAGEETLDVCLGYDTIAAYERNDGYLGAVIGRYAGRIPGAVLTLGGKRFALLKNDGENHLHGGAVGFDKHIFAAECTDDSVCFTYRSPDGEEGYPAALSVSVTYTLRQDNTLILTLCGVSDGLTVWNPTSHAYWNLNGHQSGTALDHTLSIDAGAFVPVDSHLIPIGITQPVDGTPFDFHTPRVLRDGFKDDVILKGNGYDHSLILDSGRMELCGNNGVCMQIKTDCRAVQLYTANFLSERCGKGGAVYAPHNAVCLETESRQLFKGAPIPDESLMLPGKTKTHTTEFRFLYRGR